jgi:hypothetical protein
MSVQDMRAELKLLRQEHPDHQPVSKMKKADISSLLEKMKQKTEITPATAMMKAEPMKEKGDATAPKEKPMKAEKAMKEPKKAEKKDAAPKKAEKAEKPMKEKESKKKETIAERMARIREMKKKE